MDTINSVKPNIVIVLNIIKLSATDSTNSYLKQLVQETEVQDQTIVFADEQQKGRGQMGNGWFSIKGQSLTFSVFKRFEALLAEKQFIISMAVSIAIAEAFKELGIPNTSIKWPNDIMSGNKKIAGILIENVLDGAYVKHSVIGIGINVNLVQLPNLPQASSLKLETGFTFTLDSVSHNVLEKMFGRLNNLSVNDFSILQNDYEKRMFRKNSVSVFENREGIRFNGMIKGISKIGELIIETEQTTSKRFQLKELKLIY